MKDISLCISSRLYIPSHVKKKHIEHTGLINGKVMGMAILFTPYSIAYAVIFSHFLPKNAMSWLIEGQDGIMKRYSIK